MIVYYPQITLGTGTRKRNPRARLFIGPLKMDEVNQPASCLGARTSVRKCTVFDDSTEPPTLVRADIDPAKLKAWGAPIADHYIDENGNIVDTMTGATVMRGPEQSGNQQPVLP